MSTDDRREEPATAHPWDHCDGSCDCHIGICIDCGCTNEREAQGEQPAPLDVERLYLAMVNLDTEDAGIFNIIAISEPDTRPVAEALAAEYARLSAQPSTEPAQGEPER